MKTASVLFSMLKADFLERTRRSSFLVTLCLVIYLGYAVNSGQILIKLGAYRGIFNSAWVGSLMAVVATFFLGLFGFFLTKNTVTHDERTGVGQVLAATPLSRLQYLFGKWLSNFVLLSSLVAILALGAIAMQLLQGEDTHIQIWALSAPLLFIALPMMALVAALAVLFEAIRWLKGGFGNLVYFGVFTFLLVAGIQFAQLPWMDVIGLNLVSSNMKAAAHSIFPAYDGTFTLAMISGKPLETFAWPGIDWTAGLIVQRLLWLVIAIGVTLASSLFFNRFDPSGRSLAKQNHHNQIMQDETLKEEPPITSSGLATSRLTPLTHQSSFHSNFLRLVWLECLLLVKGLPWYWLSGLAALWVACIAFPAAGLGKMTFLLVALWPVLLWSKLGEREARYQTGQLIFQTANPVLRPLASSWLAGVLVTAIALSGALVGRLLSAEPLALLPWLLSVLFIPSLALCLGTWGRSSKLFEVVYPILWYLGPFNPQNQLTSLDFLGIHSQAPINTQPALFAGGILLLLLVGLVGRWRQTS